MVNLKKSYLCNGHSIWRNLWIQKLNVDGVSIPIFKLFQFFSSSFLKTGNRILQQFELAITTAKMCHFLQLHFCIWKWEIEITEKSVTSQRNF